MSIQVEALELVIYALALSGVITFEQAKDTCMNLRGHGMGGYPPKTYAEGVNSMIEELRKRVR